MTPRQRAHHGDVIVLTTHPDITPQAFDKFARTAQQLKPRGVELLILGGGVNVHIARRSRTPRRGATPRWAR
jgi:hypothetical protein